jgi:hypothetical protein
MFGAYGLNSCMRFFEFKTIKPLTPQQARLRALKIAKDNAAKALKAERVRQKMDKAQQNLIKDYQAQPKT